MSYNTLTYAVSEGILTLTLNRPEQLNSFTLEMARELVDAFNRASDDDAVGTADVSSSGHAGPAAAASPAATAFWSAAGAVLGAGGTDAAPGGGLAGDFERRRGPRAIVGVGEGGVGAGRGRGAEGQRSRGG